MSKKVGKITIRIKDRWNNNPDFGPLGNIGYTASFHPVPDGVSGCPMGRSPAKDGAVKDLLARANMESKVLNKNELLKVLESIPNNDELILAKTSCATYLLAKDKIEISDSPNEIEVNLYEALGLE